MLGTSRSPWRTQPQDVPREGGIFNHEYGYINPYYPNPVDTALIRVGAEDYHEGWVSKYLYSKPTVSPYLSLLRHDILEIYGSTRYHAFVVPLLKQRAAVKDSKRGTPITSFGLQNPGTMNVVAR